MLEENMRPQSIYEPDEKLMDAADVCEDAQQIASILQRNQAKAEPVVRLQIPPVGVCVCIGPVRQR